jgi:hypothetical protein
MSRLPRRRSSRSADTPTLALASPSVKGHATAGASESIRAVQCRGIGKDHLQLARAGHPTGPSTTRRARRWAVMPMPTPLAPIHLRLAAVSFRRLATRLEELRLARRRPR